MPTPGPSGSISLRRTYTARISVALPTPVRLDASTPCPAAGTQGFQQVRLVEGKLGPFGELADLPPARS
nr:hypothetical protein [Mycobacterium lepromatosis]